jgi:hypothetical protein
MEILTEKGFKNFEGFIHQGKVGTLLRVFLSGGGSIDCTEDHRFMTVDGVFKEGKKLSQSDSLYPDQKITAIQELDYENGIDVYDAFNVNDTHSYMTNGVISHNCDLIFLDEFAFVNRAEEFYTSTYPVISSGANSKVIITSTANGVGNLFHKIWEGAVQGTNEYKPFRIDWWDVPGRDEEWKRQTIANTSEMQFRQEFSNEFIGTSDTLISADKLLGLHSENPIYQQDSVRVYERPDPDANYMMFVDVCKGRGKDFSTFTIIDITSKPFKQVAVYQDSMISPLLFPDIIYKYARTYNDAYVVIENNDQGSVVCNGLYYELEYENVFVESAIKSTGIGVYMDKKVKRIGVSNLKDLIEEGQLWVRDSPTIIELSTFVARGSSYEAADGNHDDLVMNLVLFAWFATTQMFAEFTDIDVKKMMYEEQMKMIEDDVLPFGEIDNGLDNRYEVIDGDVWVSDDTPDFGIFH